MNIISLFSRRNCIFLSLDASGNLLAWEGLFSSLQFGPPFFGATIWITPLNDAWLERGVLS